MVSIAWAGDPKNRKMQAAGRRQDHRFICFARESSTEVTRDDGSMELSDNSRRSILTQKNQELRIRFIVSLLVMIYYVNIAGVEFEWVGA